MTSWMPTRSLQTFLRHLPLSRRSDRPQAVKATRTATERERETRIGGMRSAGASWRWRGEVDVVVVMPIVRRGRREPQ